MVKKNTPKTIISYSIEHLNKTDKVKFFYALKGRNGKQGILSQNKIEQLGRAVILVPDKSKVEITKFLNEWGCSYNKKNVIIVGEK